MENKQIRVVLEDGVPEGFRTGEILTRWTGKAIVSPIQDIQRLRSYLTSGKAGVYIIMGESENVAERPSVYIGQAGDLWDRIGQQLSGRGNTRINEPLQVVAIYSTDENLTTAHTTFLELSMIQAAKLAQACELKNGNDGVDTPLPRADKADMTYFFDQVKIVMPVLGVHIFQVLRFSDAGVRSASVVFELVKESVSAEMVEVGTAFVVKRGAVAKALEVPSMPAYYSNLRHKLKQEGILQQDGLNLKLTQDNAFSSVSAAAAIILGRSAQGTREWKVKGTNTTYADFVENRVKDADPSDLA